MRAGVISAVMAAVESAGVSISILPERTIPVVRRERDDSPRKQTEADRERLVAAEAKRARKAAKRKGGVL